MSGLETWLGLDEAGRGSVIGPMAVAAVWVPAGRAEELAALGARDSKQVPREQRAAVLARIEAVAFHSRVVLVPPERIQDDTLTRLELEAFAALIGERPADRIFLDVPAPPRGIARFLEALEHRVGRPLPLVGENRADQTYPIVGAASILAKVTRDRELDALREAYGDVGWGYPGEPRVKRFLEEWYRREGCFPPVVRSRWSTAREIAAALDQGRLFGGQPNPAERTRSSER
ncbi:ribonuclease HII [Limnochorda pilosa]|uniref:Ribonuclease n=2 Tax=Limnochorda pilosa TaxID=1555112 RepID=A0A0K2SIM7_LIMPI|nr:ribonuclease HII [Limnochorda pilosa]